MSDAEDGAGGGDGGGANGGQGGGGRGGGGGRPVLTEAQKQHKSLLLFAYNPQYCPPAPKILEFGSKCFYTLHTHLSFLSKFKNSSESLANMIYDLTRHLHCLNI